jgi:5-methylthioadenosine/S-adenosylhomocysteine deaminase
VFDARRRHIGALNRPLSTFVSAGRGADAKLVMIDGRICYRDGQFLRGPDATEILREAESAAEAILAQTGLSGRLAPAWRTAADEDKRPAMQ